MKKLLSISLTTIIIAAGATAADAAVYTNKTAPHNKPGAVVQRGPSFARPAHNPRAKTVVVQAAPCQQHHNYKYNSGCGCNHNHGVNDTVALVTLGLVGAGVIYALAK
ncbi:MAG: hypothetical protein FWE50_00755 [Alphaproteobacteria bacterium]|nr:hypothetical protein [Alphaproteobacteria bacterium]